MGCGAAYPSSPKDLVPQIFAKNDPQNSGRLGMQEYYSAILDLYQQLNNSPPRESLVWAKQKEHDPDGKGWISQQEFLNIAKEVSGYKGQTSQPIQNYQPQLPQSQQLIIQQQPVYYPSQPMSFQPNPPNSQPLMMQQVPMMMQQGPMIMQQGPMIIPMMQQAPPPIIYQQPPMMPQQYPPPPPYQQQPPPYY